MTMGMTLKDQIDELASIYTLGQLERMIVDIDVNHANKVDRDAEYVLQEAVHLRRVKDRLDRLVQRRS